MSVNRTFAVIGGSGLYSVPSGSERVPSGSERVPSGSERDTQGDLPPFEWVNEHAVATPYGVPSDKIVEVRTGDTTVYFLPRHGAQHQLAPHEINYRANIFALKILGAEQILSVSAVGSLREDLEPGMFVTIDQYIDRTSKRASTFFEGRGVVAHLAFADPIDEGLRRATRAAAARAGVRLKDRGTYVCVDGPMFSTRAESELYRRDGADVIGMTNLPEARLAREAELPYASLAMVTDFDCWRPHDAAVDVRAVVQVIRKNAENAQRTIRILASQLPDPALSPARNALAHALLTPPTVISEQVKRDLAPLIGRYVGKT